MPEPIGPLQKLRADNAALRAELEAAKARAVARENEFASTLRFQLDAQAQAFAASLVRWKDESDRMGQLITDQRATIAATQQALDEALAKLATVPDQLAGLDAELNQRYADNLAHLGASLDRAEHGKWAARGGIAMTLATQRNVTVDQIPEADVDAACDAWESQFPQPPLAAEDE